MELPLTVNGQFVDSVLFSTEILPTLMGSIQVIGKSGHTPGLYNPASMVFTPSTLTVQVQMPLPFMVLFSNGSFVAAHGTVNNADTQTTTVSFASLVPGSGSVTAYLIASKTTIGQSLTTVTGPPPGHPDYDPALLPFEFNAVQQDTLTLTASLTPPDNLTTFELCRISLSVGQASITGGQIDKTHWHYASAVLNPTGVTAGSYTMSAITVGADGRVTAASSTTVPISVATGGTGKTSYTAGDVIFAGAGGTTLAEDAGQFFWDATNNRLGIGNSSPSFTLDVSGSGHFTSGATITGDTHTSTLTVDANATIGTTLGVVGAFSANSGATITGNTHTSTLAVDANATIGTTLGVTGALFANGGATVTGNAHCGTITVDGNTSVGGVLGVTGLLSANGGAQITGNAHCGTITVDGNTSIGGVLGVTGLLSANGGAQITGNAHCTSATIDTTLGVSGAFFANAGATITGNTHTSTVTCDGAMTVGSSMTAVTDVRVSNGSMHAVSTATDQGFAATGPTPLIELISTTTGNTYLWQNIANNTLSLSYNLAGIAHIDSSGTYTQTSDASLKENFTEITDALGMVERLHPGRYNWKATGEPGIGFIAQEVQEIVPEVVSEMKDGLLGLSYGNLAAISISAIKELMTENRMLRDRLDRLEAGGQWR